MMMTGKIMTPISMTFLSLCFEAKVSCEDFDQSLSPAPAPVLMLQGVESRGKYTTKEEVEKAPSEDHPCNLTRTSFKVFYS